MKHLILLHGALGHPDDFNPYQEWLSRHFTLHTILFQGHGSSEVPTAGIRIEDYVQQLAQYIESHQLKDVYVFGYSMGGYVALAYARQYPGIVASILTLATKLHWTEEGAVKESSMLNPAVIKEKVPKYAATLAAQHGAAKWEQLLPAIGGLMIALGKQPLLGMHNYGDIHIPVQLMVGDKDMMVSIEETMEVAKAIPEARFAVLPQTKHPIGMARPALITALMQDYWDFVQ